MTSNPLVQCSSPMWRASLIISSGLGTATTWGRFSRPSTHWGTHSWEPDPRMIPEAQHNAFTTFLASAVEAM
jgi:hypothetical protein